LVLATDRGENIMSAANARMIGIKILFIYLSRDSLFRRNG